MRTIWATCPHCWRWQILRSPEGSVSGCGASFVGLIRCVLGLWERRGVFMRLCQAITHRPAAEKGFSSNSINTPQPDPAVWNKRTSCVSRDKKVSSLDRKIRRKFGRLLSIPNWRVSVSYRAHAVGSVIILGRDPEDEEHQTSRSTH